EPRPVSGPPRNPSTRIRRSARRYLMIRSSAFRLALIWIGARLLEPSATAQPIDTAWVWTTPGYDIGASGIAVSDFDGDGRDELHLASLGGSYYGPQDGYWHEWR